MKRRFEYKTEGRLVDDPMFPEELNDLGDEGWELVNVRNVNRAEPGSTDIAYTFKREIIA